MINLLTELCLFSDSSIFKWKTVLWTQYLESHLKYVDAQSWMQDKDALNNFSATVVFVLVNNAHFRTKHFVGNKLVNKLPKKTLSAMLMMLCILLDASWWLLHALIFVCGTPWTFLFTFFLSILNKLWLWYIVPFMWEHMARAWCFANAISSFRWLSAHSNGIILTRGLKTPDWNLAFQTRVFRTFSVA